MLKKALILIVMVALFWLSGCVTSGSSSSSYGTNAVIMGQPYNYGPWQGGPRQ